MRKSFQLSDLDCANCAAKLEAAISQIPELSNVSVSFMAQKLSFDTNSDNLEEIIKQIRQIINKIEPDCELID